MRHRTLLVPIALLGGFAASASTTATANQAASQGTPAAMSASPNQVHRMRDVGVRARAKGALFARRVRVGLGTSALAFIAAGLAVVKNDPTVGLGMMGFGSNLLMLTGVANPLRAVPSVRWLENYLHQVRWATLALLAATAGGVAVGTEVAGWEQAITDPHYVMPRESPKLFLIGLGAWLTGSILSVQSASLPASGEPTPRD